MYATVFPGALQTLPLLLSRNLTTHRTEPPMPKNQVSDPITDQEIAFAHLILSGTMTDRRAAEAVRLNPDTAAYTKAKPRVLHARAPGHRSRTAGPARN